VYPDLYLDLRPRLNLNLYLYLYLYLYLMPYPAPNRTLFLNLFRRLLLLQPNHPHPVSSRKPKLNRQGRQDRQADVEYFSPDPCPEIVNRQSSLRNPRCAP
jgi:hypothetical protein